MFGSAVTAAIPCRLGEEAGYRRAFCMRIQDLTSTSMVASDHPQTINGKLWPAPAEYFAGGRFCPDGKDPIVSLFDVESTVPGVQRVELRREHFVVLHDYMSIPAGARIWAYVAKVPMAPDRDHPILQSVIDKILVGCLEVGEEFAEEWVDTTDGWILEDGHAYWLNDRRIARRPWVAQGKYKVIDRIIQESSALSQTEGALHKRRLIAEYVTVL